MKRGLMLSLKSVSKKYSFALIGIFLSMWPMILTVRLGLSERLIMWLSISTQAVILIITVSYLTGQAKIDLSAKYGEDKD